MAASSEAVVALENVSITYRSGVRAVEGFSLHVREGEFISLVGPSGCGKSTVLNLIARFLNPGLASVSGQVHVRARRLGYVFQRDTLLPWRSVLDNVAVGLELNGYPRREREALARDLLAKLGLAAFERSYPHQLSGGMRQRVALARTLVYSPEVILLDEPLGALDAQTRVLLQAELIRAWKDTGKTVILVTHDLAEAITVSQRVLVISHRPGRVRAEYAIDIAGDRDPMKLRSDARFIRLHTEIWTALSEEVLRQAADGEALAH